MNEITKPTPRAWNGQPIRNSVDDVMRILAPMYAQYFQVTVPAEAQAVYIDMLRDIAPDKLAACVRQCMAECKWIPTVAEIRERYEEARQPMPPRIIGEERPALNPNAKLYRESPAERMERMKRIEQRERNHARH